MNRKHAALVSIALIGATLSPLSREPVDDGYPLSTYPMFAWKRPTQMTMSYPVGESPRGRRYLTPRIIGSGEVLQARAIVERSVRSGGKELTNLCERIAKNVTRDPEYADVTRIRILTGTHESIAFLVDQKLGPEHQRTQCEVKR
jgi:hypothetical protein